MQHAKDTTKQIIDVNTKTAQTLEQNTRQMTDAVLKYNASFNANQNNTNTSYTTSTPSGTTSTTSSTTSAA